MRNGSSKYNALLEGELSPQYSEVVCSLHGAEMSKAAPELHLRIANINALVSGKRAAAFFSSKDFN